MLPTTPITDADLAELVERMDEAAAAYIRGDVHRYLALVEHAEDYTLMPPYGGPTEHGFERTAEDLRRTSEFFAAGEATFDLEQSYTAGDLAVLVGVERQHGEVGGRPDQDWSLRVTLVLRRVGERWHLVHRHADPLVRPVSFDRFAELARGG